MHPDVFDDEADTLGTLLVPVDKSRFHGAIRRLHAQFAIYAATCPVPLPAPGLIVTPEIRTHSELFLPIADVAAIFNRLYSAVLTYPPIFSSTPFFTAMSWADAFASLPPQFQFSANPARLLESLLADGDLLNRFLFASFLPERFYGGIARYSEQQQYIREWLIARKAGPVRCLDAACGTGEGSYGLALLLASGGFLPDDIRIEGWTVEPLEVWVAAHRRFPHDPRRELLFREETRPLIDQGFRKCLQFRCVDLTGIPCNPPLPMMEAHFDLIICNGLLGGPIINGREQMERTVENLVNRLAPAGVLLAADNFHGGWKRKCPQTALRALFEAYGLSCFTYGEGLGGLKPD